MSVTTALDDLAAAVDGHAREAEPGDAVDGVPARWVAAPGSTEEAAALLGVAARLGLAVVPRGRGTAMGWGAPPRAADLVVTTERLDRVVEHNPGDLVCVLQAGVRIDDVNAQVGRHGQQLALDQPLPGASIGGTLSTARSGPRRVLYGTPRDQVLGVTLVRADGVPAKAGSKVVKNVAGYDLAKLVGGAFGTLGLVCSLVVRLHPIPRARRWLHGSYTDADAAVAAAQRVVGAQLAPSAVEVRRDPGTDTADVFVLLEGTAAGVDGRTRGTLDLLAEATATDEIALEGGDALAALRGTGAGTTLVKVAVPIPALARVLSAIRAAEHRHGVACHVQGSAVGVLYVVVGADAPAESVARTVTDLRAEAEGGSVVVLQAPAGVRDLVDVWGPVGGLSLMRRLKDEFDPEHRLAPGRFVGGI